jgi:hypothetical protein
MQRINVSDAINRKSINKARSLFKTIKLPFKEISAIDYPREHHFMEGCWIDRGVLHYCPSKVLIGSLLHEAGHLATTPRQFWSDMRPGDLAESPIVSPFGVGGDFAAEAWCFAAANAAGISSELSVVGSTSIASTKALSGDDFAMLNTPSSMWGLSSGEIDIWVQLVDQRHIGIRLLACAGMIAKSSRYPVMHRWFWHNRDKWIGFDRGLIDMIASDGIFGHSDKNILKLWEIEN